MRPATRVFVITGVSYVPVLVWVSLIPLFGELSLGAALGCAIVFLGAALCTLLWAAFALILSYRETPRRHRRAFTWLALGCFALPWTVWLLLAAVA